MMPRERVAPYLERDSIVSHGIFDPDRVDILVSNCARQDSMGFPDNSALLGVLSTQMILEQFC
jgi:hypothetical protein